MAALGFWPWVLFNLFVIAMLAIDLGVFHRKNHAVKTKEALIWTGVWVSLAGIFTVILYFWLGSQQALEFVTGYVIEYSLSVDNIFVFILLFTFFRIPPAYQHRVLFWGILGALIMRGTFIVLGAALLERFHWIIYLFGAFLVITGIKMALNNEDAEVVEPKENLLVRLVKKVLPVTAEYDGSKFFTRVDGKLAATPLFIVLLIVETTDLIFAVDSIPAIFAITRDPFIVYTSNIFAILGLRSLYFALAGIMNKFHYLKLGLAVVLTFVGVKMLVSGIYKIPITLSLGIIVGTLVVAVIASLMRAKRLEDLGITVDPVAEVAAKANADSTTPGDERGPRGGEVD